MIRCLRKAINWKHRFVEKALKVAGRMNKKIKENLLRKGGWVGCFYIASHKFAVNNAIGSFLVRQRSRIDPLFSTWCYQRRLRHVWEANTALTTGKYLSIRPSIPLSKCPGKRPMPKYPSPKKFQIVISNYWHLVETYSKMEWKIKLFPYSWQIATTFTQVF